MAIAWFAKQLNVTSSTAAAFHDRDDVIEFQTFVTATTNTFAFVALPHEELYVFFRPPQYSPTEGA